MRFSLEENDLQDQTVIFEQEMPEFKVNKRIKRELHLLKIIWDYVIVINTSLNEWKTTVWKKIDVEFMDQECKKLLRELRRKKYFFRLSYYLCNSDFHSVFLEMSFLRNEVTIRY